MRDARTIQPLSTPSQPPQKSIPNILFPALQDDEVLYATVESARWQAVISDSKIPKPELVDCVRDSTANHFSLELKQYLEPTRRLRRTEEYFACYWLIAILVWVSPSCVFPIFLLQSRALRNPLRREVRSNKVVRAPGGVFLQQRPNLAPPNSAGTSDSSSITY
jgi:hypothetical protein